MEMKWGVEIILISGLWGVGLISTICFYGQLIKYPDKVVEKLCVRQVASQIMYSAEALDNLTTSGAKPTPFGCYVGTAGSRRIYTPVSKS